MIDEKLYFTQMSIINLIHVFTVLYFPILLHCNLIYYFRIINISHILTYNKTKIKHK